MDADQARAREDMLDARAREPSSFMLLQCQRCQRRDVNLLRRVDVRLVMSKEHQGALFLCVPCLDEIFNFAPSLHFTTES